MYVVYCAAIKEVYSIPNLNQTEHKLDCENELNLIELIINNQSMENQ